ncbi:D-lyxose/D-mannose family sugar isomerase [Avibacterium paragallinarum]|uniref:D-lyxose/D-mannose family sugar isomerase n=1 Tax=Avibacterium paragallinarum TaxID=728 RepID=UPI00397A43E8
MNQYEKQKAQERTIAFLQAQHIALSEKDRANVEVTDFALNEWEKIGLQLITLVNNARYCAKLLVLFPQQNCPEHRHPPFEGSIGKQETFRCLFGEVYLFVEAQQIEAQQNMPQNLTALCKQILPPEHRKKWYTATQGLILKAGDQFTIPPNTKHWFQAGDLGAIIAEYSSESRDEFDIFTDPEVIRIS